MAGRILVTGAAGFIGWHLCEALLASGRQVTGLDNFCDFYSPQLKRANAAALAAHDAFEMCELDLRDADAVQRCVQRVQPELIVHLAAMAGVRPSIERPAYYTSVNVDGTVHLLNAAVEVGANHFVFASSSSVYGNNRKVPFAETDAVDEPISPYAATKRSGELIAHAFTHLHELPVTCLRFFTVYGPGQRPDLAISKFLHLAREGEPIPMFGDGSTSRDYTYIDDIVAGVRAAMDRPLDKHPYRIYNLGGDAPVSLKDLIATIGRVTGKAVHTHQQPMQPGDVQQTWADLTRSRAELGYAPATPLATGIERQWRWMQEQTRQATPARR